MDVFSLSLVFLSSYFGCVFVCISSSPSLPFSSALLPLLQAPWSFLSSDPPSPAPHRERPLSSILFCVSEFLRRLALFLAPVTPGIADGIFGQLNVPRHLRVLRDLADSRGDNILRGGDPIEKPRKLI